MTDMATNILLVRRLNDALFRDDRLDQIMRRHVERRIENLGSLGRQGLAENMGNLFGIALLDGDLFTGRTIKVDGRGRSGDVERNAFPHGQILVILDTYPMVTAPGGCHPVAPYY